MQVLLAEDFKKGLENFPKEDRRKIAEFILFVQQNGFTGLPGRNKSSDSVPTDDPQWLEKVQFAQRHNLWHYHIGIPEYKGSRYGDFTSAYILHYILGEGFIKIVGFDSHPPFILPDIPERQL